MRLGKACAFDPMDHEHQLPLLLCAGIGAGGGHLMVVVSPELALGSSEHNLQ